MRKSEIYKELAKKGIVVITYIFNALNRFRYLNQSLKQSEIILILQPHKELTDIC